jgi:flagellar protein FlaJ
MSLDRRRSDGDEPAAIEGFSVEALFYPVYQRMFDEDSDFVADIEKKLSQARMSSNVEMYLSRAIGVGALTGFALWLIGTFIGLLVAQLFGSGPIIGIPLPDTISTLLDIIRSPLILVVTGVVFGTIGFVVGFGGLAMMPYIRSTSREREINTLLPDTIAFMYALSVGGMNQLEIVRAAARADDTYGEVAKEFQSIILETEYFDTDYRTAVQNQAIETPSDELGQFLTDMLSILDSGGDMTQFLEDQKDKHIRTAKQEQEKQLETLELFGEMYMTLSLFPLLLIIILVIMSMMGGGSQEQMLYITVYGLIPMIGVAFLVMVSTVTQDEFGDGYLRPNADEEFNVDDSASPLSTGLVNNYTGDYGVFDQIQSLEGRYKFNEILSAPHLFFRDNPLLILGLTAPVTLLIYTSAILTGNAPLSLGGIKDQVLWGTFLWIYVPIYVNLLPLAIFHEWNVRSRRAVLGDLSENLRKLASANDTGMTLLESIRVVADTSSGKLSNEFEKMYAKVNYGTGLKAALREFNNDYHIPRLARTVKLISEAQETSSQIQEVLSTAATTSENQDDIDRERAARTRMQMVIIIMTYLTLLAVMALLQVQFLDAMTSLADQQANSDGAAGEFIGNLDGSFLSMLFFHAVTIQAIISAIVAGYIRNVDLVSGAKYAVFLATTALVVWLFVEQLTSGGGDGPALGLLLLLATGWSGRDVCRGVRDRLPVDVARDCPNARSLLEPDRDGRTAPDSVRSPVC